MSVREKAKKLSKNEQALINRVQDYASFFNSDEGSRVLLDLIENGFLFRPINAATTEEAFINEGKRQLVLHILAQLQMTAGEMMDKLTNIRNNQEKFYEFED